VKTGATQQLFKGFCTMPAWSPDGSKLAVDLRPQEGFQVGIIDAKVLKSLEKIEPPRDRYEVPEGNVKELLEFIQDLRSFRPKSYQEYSEHRSKAPQALKSAAEKIMKLEKDESSEAYQTAVLVLLEGRVRNIASVSLAEKKQVLKELTDVLTKKSAAGLAPSDLSLAMSAARALEYGNERELAAEAYERFAGLIADSNDEKMARYAKMLAGAARRLRLPGNELELKGTLLGGDEFDWAAYRGKVVLVDFWATWCGPCRAELPNVRKYYELYHDRGFDVVGISLDRNRKALENFLEKEKLPWVTLYEEDAEGSHPMATHYGVMAIPTVLLVDQEGKVVSLRARGEELGKLLKEQLGPVDEEKLREIEERMRQDARKPASKAAPPPVVKPHP